MISRILLTTPKNGYLDIKTGASFPINFSLGDIRDISKRNGSFSKTITLTGSKNNNILLGHLYDVNVVDGTFNINTLQECLVEQDGIVILDNMYLQLTSIKKVQKSGSHDYDVEYECEIKDSSADFFNKISNLELTDLDFSEFNGHLYSVASVTASFTHTWEDGYKYIVPEIQTAVSLNGDDRKYILKKFRPGLYTRQYWDKIFANAGYTYTFDEMDNSDIQFSKLIIPYNGDDIKTEENIELNVEAVNSIDIEKTYTAGLYTQTFDYTSVIPVNLNAPSQIIIDTEISDNQNQYNPVTGVFQPSFNVTGNATIDFTFSIDYEIDIVTPGGLPITLTSVDYPVTGVNILKPGFLLRNNTSGVETPQYFDEYTINYNTTFAAGATTLVSKTINFVVEAGNILSTDSIIEKLFFSVEDTSPHSGYNVYVNNGVETIISSIAWFDSNSAIVQPQYKLRITNINMSIEPKDLSLDYGVPVIMNAFIPKKIKQSNFIKSLCQMYNLYIDVDPDNVTNLIIKTRDKFYDDGVVKDWTKKLAKEKQQDLKFLPELSNKKLLLTYKQDKDIANVGYFNNTNEIYGQVEYVFENEYVKGIDKKELIFSPTPMVETNFGANVPYIEGFAPKNNIRILLDNGVYDCEDYYITDIVERTISNYPYVGHFNDPTNPTFDINYATCDYYFYNDYTITDNNLYNLHWRRTLGQINNGKLLKAYFNLTSNDIQKFSLNDKIRIDNSYWVVNKIIDYDANVKKLTAVELISVDEEFDLPPFKTKRPRKPNTSFGPIRDIVIGGPVGGGPGGVGGGGSPGPVGPVKPNNPNIVAGPYIDVKGTGNTVDKNSISEIGGNNNFVGPGTSTVKGNDNNLKSAGIVYGDSNTIDYASKSNLIVGDRNTIGPGVENSIILGNDISVYESNTLAAGQFKAGNTTINQNGVLFTGGQYWDCGYTEEEYVGATCSKGTFFSFDLDTNETRYDINIDRVFVNGVEIPSGGSGSVGPTGATGPQGEIGPTGPSGGGGGSYSIGTSAISITMSSDVLLVDTSISSITVTLPTAVGLSGETRIIKDKSGNAYINNVIVTPDGSETIDGTASVTMDINSESITLLSDGADWWMI